MDKYNELLEMVTSMEKDFQKFYDGDNKAAGTRIRKGLQDLKALKKIGFGRDSCARKPGFFVLVVPVLSPKKHPKN